MQTNEQFEKQLFLAELAYYRAARETDKLITELKTLIKLQEVNHALN